MKGQDEDKVNGTIHLHSSYCYGWVQGEGQIWELPENIFPPKQEFLPWHTGTRF